MRRTEPRRIGEIFEDVLKSTELERRLLETRASEAWAYVVGPGLASLTGKPWCRDGVMTIRVPSPALRNELTMNRSALIKALNKALAYDDVVKEIIFKG